MFMKRPQYRKFDYQPRFYKPELDEGEKRKRRLGFRSNIRKRSNTKIPWPYIIMLAIILFIFLKYNGYI
jgi:hypothetical protein